MSVVQMNFIVQRAVAFRLNSYAMASLIVDSMIFPMSSSAPLVTGMKTGMVSYQPWPPNDHKWSGMTMNDHLKVTRVRQFIILNVIHHVSVFHELNFATDRLIAKMDLMNHNVLVLQTSFTAQT